MRALSCGTRSSGAGSGGSQRSGRPAAARGARSEVTTTLPSSPSLFGAPSCVLFLLPTVFLRARLFLRRLSLPGASRRCLGPRPRGAPSHGGEPQPPPNRRDKPTPADRKGTENSFYLGDKHRNKKPRRSLKGLAGGKGSPGLRARCCSCSPRCSQPSKVSAAPQGARSAAGAGSGSGC